MIDLDSNNKFKYIPKTTFVFSFFMIIFINTIIGSYAYSELPTPTKVMISTIKDPEDLIKNEVIRLDTLIQATQQSLNGQIALRAKIIEYQKIQELHLQYPENNDILLRMVKSAYRTFELIKENNLIQTFDPDFINELKVFSQAATKRGIPKEF